MIPECVGGDGDDTLRTLLRGETGRVLQRLVGERRQVKSVLIPVAEPRARGHGENGLRALHVYAKQLDGPRAQVPGPRV